MSLSLARVRGVRVASAQRGHVSLVLQVLNLCAVYLTEDDIGGLELLRDALSVNTSIEQVDLDSNFFGKQGHHGVGLGLPRVFGCFPYHLLKCDLLI